jgi:predicted DNA-binding protein YlxM (UPF0122 family)
VEDKPDLKDDAKPEKETRKKLDGRRNNRVHRKKLTQNELVKVLDLTLKKVSQTDIAKVTGFKPQAINDTIERFKPVLTAMGDYEGYNQNRARILSAIEGKLLESLTDEEKHKEANLQQVAISFDKIHNAGRLERGLSTANISQRTTVFTDVTLGNFNKDE